MRSPLDRIGYGGYLKLASEWDGFIDTIATDHCSFQSYEKDWGKDDFTKIPNGCAGVETQTSRCLLCENAPCSHACTSHLPVSDIIRSFRFENHMGAAERSCKM